MKKINFFCLPYAGSSASIFFKWKKYLDEDIMLYPIELAGRGKRIKEPLYNSLNEAIEDIYNQIEPALHKQPFSFFGHSIGSTPIL